MKAFVMGGTGFLGSRLIPMLQADGHQVTVLTRSREKADQLTATGVRTLVGDVRQPDTFREKVGPQDAVVMMVMPPVPIGSRISHRAFQTLQQETTTLYANAMAVARETGVVLVATSGASFRTSGDAVADETWPIDRSGLAGIGAKADPLFAEAFRTGDPPLVLMLPGQIYGNGGLFRNMTYEWMKQGRFRVIGSGDNCIPRIHVDDCAHAFALAVKSLPIGEKLIIADDQPCTTREFADFMAERMGVPRPGRLPGLLVRPAKGDLTYRTVMMHCRVSNARAKRVLSWEPVYPTYREGLSAVIAEIEGK